MPETIRVAYGKPIPVPISKLNALQGELKELSEQSYVKLRKEIIDTGFAFSPHVWADKSGKYWLVDGHQRIATLLRMEKEGMKIPKIPVTPVEAKDIKEARRRVLQGVSQYGHVTQQGLFDFITAGKMDIEDITLSFDMPEIDLEEFKADFFDKIEPKDVEGSQEIFEEDVSSKLVHTCPKCGFSFASKDK